MRRSDLYADLQASQEAIYSPLYDYQRIDSTANKLYFFSHPVGQGKTCRNYDGCKTTFDTNMYLANSLPAGQAFLVTGVRVLVVPDCLEHRGFERRDRQDVSRILLGGTLRFILGNRDYLLDGPLAKFPSMMPRTWMAELRFDDMEKEEAHWAAVYNPSIPALNKFAYYSIVPVHIPAHQCFQVIAEMDPGPLHAPAKVGVILDGRLLRVAI